MSEERITISIDGGIADVRMNRPDKMNALDTAQFKAMHAAAEQLAADPSVRVVVLSGEGRAFCAGLDFSGFESMAGNGDGASQLGDTEDGRITHYAQQAVYGFSELRVPVIAAITGVALGAGIQLAMGADIRFIAPDAKMSVLEIRWGIVPDMTGTRRLSELVGVDVAKELVWTGRMVEGPEAVQLGLATHVSDDPHAAAMKLAKEIASKSPHAIQAGKRLVNAAGQLDDAAGFAAERAEIGALIGTPNQLESISAWFEKRAPEYADPDL
jgi:enoyl-CoA hydratase/carnithine racemase